MACHGPRCGHETIFLRSGANAMVFTDNRKKRQQPKKRAPERGPFLANLCDWLIAPCRTGRLIDANAKTGFTFRQQGFFEKMDVFFRSRKKPRLQGVQGAASPQGEHYDTDTFRGGRNKSTRVTANDGGTKALRMYCQPRVTKHIG